MTTGAASMIGTELDGRYRILRRIGAGGMGTVFEAMIRSSGARLAIKTLNGDHAERPDASARFRRESRAASSILHPNVVRTLDVGVTKDGVHYLVMELLRGASLAEILERGTRLELPAIVAVLRGVLEGLVAAHAVGVVHRDLKPDNVFLHVAAPGEEATPKIVDFGISKIRGSESLRMTGTGMILGSPYYMAPEQARAAPDVDHRADVYGVGVIAYELVTGARPFAAASAQMILVSILRDRPAPVAELAPDCPPSLVAWIERAMAHDRDDRFPSPAAALNALLDSVRGTVSDAAMRDARRALGELADHRQLQRQRGTQRGGARPNDDAATVADDERISLPAGTARPALAGGDRRLDERLAIAAAVAGAFAGLWTFVTSLREGTLGPLQISAFGSPTGTAVGAGLVACAWLTVGVGSSFARARGVARPLAVLAYTQAIYLVHLAMREVVPGLAGNRIVFTIGEGASLWTLPTAVHIALRLAGREGPRSRPIVRAMYALAALLVPFVGTRWYGTVHGSGVVAGPLLITLLPVLVAALLWPTIVLWRATLRLADVERRRRTMSLAMGLPLYGALQIGDAASYAGLQVRPPTLLSFLPIGMIAYGAIGNDLLLTSQGIASALRFGRVTALRLLALCVTIGVVVGGRSIGPHTDLRNLAPPLVTAALCLTLSWQALSIEETTAGTLSWGVVVALFGLLKLDVAINTVVGDAQLGLWVSRIDHFFFVFMPVAVVHVIRSVARWKRQRWVPWTFWIAALAVAPLTFSEAYFPYSTHHWYGYFARAGWIYLAYQVVVSAALGYGAALVASSAYRARGAVRSGYLIILIGFAIAAGLLLVGDQRSVMGVEVYPYGNFAFVPFGFMTYGILRGELADFRGVVRTAVAHGTLSTLLTGVLAAMIVGVVRLTAQGGPLVSAACAALVTMLALGPIRGWAQRGVDRVLGTDHFDEARAFRAFAEATGGLVRMHDVADAARRVVEETFLPNGAAVLLRVDDGGYARGPFCLDGDDAALVELRRTLDVVRCGGPGAEVPSPPGLAGWRGEIVLVPLAHHGRMFGVLAIAPSERAPLTSRRATSVLRAFGDHVALVLENSSLFGEVEAAVDRRTAELADLISKLETEARRSRVDEADVRAGLLQELRLQAEELRTRAREGASRASIDAALDMVEGALTHGRTLGLALADTAIGADQRLRRSTRTESGARRVR